jgi:SNF2 family DNA or RNA helicase
MKTKIFKAMKKLHANFRWCLTGTPVQNSLEDIAALISFIRSSPLDDLRKFRRHIISPLVRGSENCVENLSKLLDCVCLRRTKQLLNLPDVTSETRLLNFSAREQQQYEYTRDKLINIIKQSKFNAKSKKGNLGVFQLQLQLRRLCNHGTFQRLSLDAEDFDPEQAISQLKKDKEATCEGCQVGISAIRGIRLPATRSGSFTVCGHLLCIACVPRMIQALQKVDEQEECFKCSLCLEMFQGDYIIVDEGFAKQHKVGSKRLSPWQYFDKSGCSAKVSALVKDLEAHNTDGKR